MRKLLSVMIGFIFLVGAGAILWETDLRSLPTNEVVTGGVLYTQPEIAALAQGNAAPALEASTDFGTGYEVQAAVPVIQGDLASTDADEAAAAPERVPNATGLTNDVVLDTGTEVVIPPAAPVGATPGEAADGSGGMGDSFVGYEQRLVELEWPEEFRTGEAGSVRVKLRMLGDGSIQPVAEIASNAVVGTPILLTSRYGTHDAFGRAQILAPDFSIKTISQSEQQFGPGEEPEWRWTLESTKTGSKVIQITLYVIWRPKPGTVGQTIEAQLWGQSVGVEVNSVLGFITIPQASWAGRALAVVGFVAQIPLLEKFLEAVWYILFGRRRRTDDRRRRR